MPNKKDSKIVFVGDLVDRGAKFYDVIKFVMDNNYDCVLGNHEKMFLQYSTMLENDRQKWRFEILAF